MESQNNHRVRKIWGTMVKYLLPLAISFGLCYVLFHDMDFSEMVAFVRRDCDFTLIFASMGVGIFAFLFRAMRWRIQLRASGIDVPLMPVVYSIVGTYAVNLVLPRLGEIWRSEYIAHRQKSPFATVLGSMFAERVADMLTVLLLFAATFIAAGSVMRDFIETKMEMPGALAFLSSPWVAVGIAGALCVAALLGWIFRRSTFMMRLKKLWLQLARGFMSIFHMKGAMKWFTLTLLLWTTYFVGLWICFRAFGLTREILDANGIIVAAVCFVLGSISMGVPSNGGIGPYQIAIVFGLQCYSHQIDQQQAYSFANVVLGSQTLLVIVCGLISFLAIALDNRRLAKTTPSGQ